MKNKIPKTVIIELIFSIILIGLGFYIWTKLSALFNAIANSDLSDEFLDTVGNIEAVGFAVFIIGIILFIYEFGFLIINLKRKK